LSKRQVVLILGAAILVASGLLIYLGRGLTPVVDEWAYISVYSDWKLETLLTPHNGHLVVFPVVIEKVITEIFGLESQLPFQLLNVSLCAAVAVLLFALIRDAVGDLLAIAAAVLILFFGAGADVLIPTFQISNLTGLCAGLAMLLLLRREDLRGDLAACAFLCISLASFSIGIAFAVGAALAIALRPPRLRLSRCWVVLVPAVLYGAWMLWAHKFHQQSFYVHNVKILGSAMVDQASAELSALTGLFTTPNGPPPESNPVPIRTTWGPVLLAGLAVLVYLRMRRTPKPGPNAWVAASVLVVYYLLVGIALNQFRNTFDTRLVYLGSVLMLVAVAELCGPYRPSRGVLACVGVVLVFSLGANIVELGDSAQFWRATSAAIKAKMAALEIAGPAADGSLPVEDPPGAANFSIEQFHEIDAEFGLPAYSQEELEASAADARQDADEELVRVMGVAPEAVQGIVPPRGTPSPEVFTKPSDPAPRWHGSCASLLPRDGAKTAVLVKFKRGGIAYRSTAPVEISIGRFADQPAVALPARAGASRIVVPATASRLPWEVGIWITAPTLLCPAAA
jgi:hypothetical protein